jgi:hypothetical protein
MFEHLPYNQTALPPPGSSRRERDALWPTRHRLAPAAVFVGTLAVIALAILSALTLLAATPAGFAVPTTLLLIGVLLAGSLALQTRDALTRRARVSVRRSRLGPASAESRETPARSARDDRTMLLQAGWGEASHPRRWSRATSGRPT